MTDPLPLEAVGELRHELRTPVNLIVGYTEMLREDTPDGEPGAPALDRILGVAREILDHINAALPPSGKATRADLDALLDALRDPQQRVLDCTAVLLLHAEGEAQLEADVRKIADAARRLTDPPRPRASSRSSGATPTPATPAVAIADIPGTNTAARILVVDDVEDNRAVLARRLSRHGYHVSAATNGREALDRIAREPFDLVLLDVMMPEMDGYQVLEQLKASEETRNIPVIMISALDDLSSVVRCIERGAEDYLSKPFDPVLLRARISASLEKKRLHDLEVDYIRQFARVIDAAEAVERGTYVSGALALLTVRDDAVGRLARVFDTMAAGVRQREERLREQLRELRDDVSIATTEYAAADAQRSDDDRRDLLRSGDVLAGRYEIAEVIGSGGMGVVYRARDRELGEEVALKMLRRELLSAGELVVDRFKSEIRLARRISHRNVVRTHDLGEADGVYFVTMEYVRGITVRELLTTRGRLGVSSTLALVRQLVEALAVAHAAGVIHRDVKPENALLDGDGVLKVMDFGIARLAERSTTSTQSGMIVGTPAYMAPEQLVGEEIDARADLYAVGVVMFECLIGAAPFQAASPVALIGKVLTTFATPPAVLSGDVPPALSALVMRLLSKSPEERPASATALLGLLAGQG